MNMFQKAIKYGVPPCDICGEPMTCIYGGGWDNDLIYCPNKDCGAQIVYPTSTVFKYETDEQKETE